MWMTSWTFAAPAPEARGGRASPTIRLGDIELDPATPHGAPAKQAGGNVSARVFGAVGAAGGARRSCRASRSRSACTAGTLPWRAMRSRCTSTTCAASWAAPDPDHARSGLFHVAGKACHERAPCFVPHRGAAPPHPAAVAVVLGALAIVWGSFVSLATRTGVHEADELTDGTWPAWPRCCLTCGPLRPWRARSGTERTPRPGSSHTTTSRPSAWCSGMRRAGAVHHRLGARAAFQRCRGVCRPHAGPRQGGLAQLFNGMPGAPARSW